MQHPSHSLKYKFRKWVFEITLLVLSDFLSEFQSLVRNSATVCKYCRFFYSDRSTDNFSFLFFSCTNWPSRRGHDKTTPPPPKQPTSVWNCCICPVTKVTTNSNQWFKINQLYFFPLLLLMISYHFMTGILHWSNWTFKGAVLKHCLKSNSALYSLKLSLHVCQQADA